MAASFDDEGPSNPWTEEQEDAEEIPEDVIEEEGGDELDYYAILNVAKDATEEEIKGSYRKLSLVYHPDRQRQEEDIHLAKEKFTNVKAAYEVLSDPKKRAVYDKLGAKAVQNYDITLRSKTPEEIEKEFQKKLNKEHTLKLMKDLGQKGTTHVWLDPNMSIRPSSWKITQLSSEQSMSFQLSPSHTFTLGGTTLIKGRGRQMASYGSVYLGFHHVLSPFTSVKTNLSFSSHAPVLSYNVSHSLDALKSQLRLGGVYEVGSFEDLLRQRSFVVGLQKEIFKTGRVNGAMTFERGLNEERLQLSLFNRDNQLLLLLRPGFRSSLLLSRTHPIAPKTKAHLTFKTSVFSSSLQLGLVHKLDWKYSVGAALAVSSHDLHLEFNFSRMTQSFVLPIALTSEVNLPLAVASCFAFIVAFGFLKKFVFDPSKAQEEKKQVEANRKKHAETIAVRKREAEAAVRSLTITVAKKREKEESKRGLLIVDAKYGRLKPDGRPEQSGDEEFPSWIDVSIPIQFQVEDSKLRLPPGPKANLVGFYDPCIGEPKRLMVTYLFKERMHKVVVNENDPLDAPLQSHLMRSNT